MKQKMKPQRKIKPEMKRSLIAEAGGKCANPGCSNWRVHIHHIKHWAVYRAHEADDMIAVCPSCHDAIHHGALTVADDELYRWKGIKRPNKPNAAHVYVEPAPTLKLLAGNIGLMTGSDRLAVFELSNANHVELRVLDDDILQVSARLEDTRGNEVLRVVENHVRTPPGRDIEFIFQAGHVRITVPATDVYVPAWLTGAMREQTFFIKDGRVVALDLKVLEPGVVKIEGVWSAPEGAVVISTEGISFCRPEWEGPKTLVGAPEGGTVFQFNGPITSKLFQF
jgi:hypothetical protein